MNPKKTATKAVTGIAPKVLEWLLEEKDPSIRFRTITQLLGRKLTADEHRQHKATIYASKAVARFFGKMLPNGDWPGRGENISPTFCIGHLAELAVDKDYPPMDLTVNRWLDLQGNMRFGGYPCGDAVGLRGLVLAGYRHHPLVKKWIARMLECGHADGGYLCPRPHFTATTRSCLHGSQKMLLAFAELPETWKTPACKALVDYFLDRRVYFKRHDHTQMPRGELRTIFPFNLRQGLLEPLYALSRMGHGSRPEMSSAWELLEQKRTPEGFYLLDWTPPLTYLKGGKKGCPSKWVTLYALLARKHRAPT